MLTTGSSLLSAPRGCSVYENGTLQMTGEQERLRERHRSAASHTNCLYIEWTPKAFPGCLTNWNGFGNPSLHRAFCLILFYIIHDSLLGLQQAIVSWLSSQISLLAKYSGALSSSHQHLIDLTAKLQWMSTPLSVRLWNNPPLLFCCVWRGLCFVGAVSRVPWQQKWQQTSLEMRDSLTWYSLTRFNPEVTYMVTTYRSYWHILSWLLNCLWRH